MSLTVTLPEGYGYVLLAATASTLVSIVHTELTSVRRSAAKVPFPNPYATAAEATADNSKYRFNCAQKSHANFTEHHATFLVNIIVAGLAFPKYSAGLGFAWTVARIMYAFGYSRRNNAENGKGRLIGAWWMLPHLLLMGMAGFSGYRLLA